MFLFWLKPNFRSEYSHYNPERKYNWCFNEFDINERCQYSHIFKKKLLVQAKLFCQ